MVTICTRLRHEPRVRAIAEAHPGVFYAAGTHPMSVAEEPLATVEELVALPRGTRRWWASAKPGWTTTTPPTARPPSRPRLRIHIEAARQTGLPLIIHARDADDDMARILTEEWRAAPYAA
jgi:TatD DNase family protein